MSIARILVINPNSSASVTDGMKAVLVAPPQTSLTFYTAPTDSPPSIDNATAASFSATICFTDIHSQHRLDFFDGFLVCCFSNHPLIHILREYTSKPTIGIFEAAITHALLSGTRFGIISTGTGFKYPRITDVHAFLGAQSSRFAGLVTSGLGVVELREGDPARVERCMKETSAKVAATGADVILLGCADRDGSAQGMAGMESLVQQGVAEAGYGPVLVVDGNKAGVEFLASLIRLSKH
ncbi:hypothetical protein EW146_g10160 [Bondarzewia mesenterica]|uniref:Asp/Glu/hydantoin racemase n=1 Tax=Bondarzewia mesenterica TaxID=1095465 RepID=A0A4S4L4M2_9AGAM|nr:hypothetical protein EW146_g10160 [Bondarzewia mesenterica]